MAISKILIANRGEIAVRVIRACKELGIATVAVYSEADRQSLHVAWADEAICIGPPISRSSYLNIAHIIGAAKNSRADAIHPGYGFLAENPLLAQACADNDIKFIGPSPEVIKIMGDKLLAKEAARQAGVPIVPGDLTPLTTVGAAQQTAQRIGYPVLLKAAKGGGGRGMQVVEHPGEMENAFRRCQSEAQAAFGDPTIYLEKYIRRARHVEVQVLFDEFGNGIHLGERDCTLQRRHQKVIEESPCLILPEAVREELCLKAVQLASAVQYSSAGTIEFVVDMDTNQFFFMEMNTRIQVEHPVTEMLTNVDLVKAQIEIAAERPLVLRQDSVHFRGHVLECRINAEDANKSFAPMPGLVSRLHFPGGPGIRIDSHCYAGYVVPPYYDSLLAKVVAWGSSRQEAISRMQRALAEVTIEPLVTNIPFLRQLVGRSEFIANQHTTKSIDRWLTEVSH